MAGDVIKEFLVLIGYKHDESALKKFQAGITQATKTVVEFAGIVTATATAVAVGITKFSENLEQLYFASQRTGSAAAGLKAFDRAAQDFGASAGSAMGAVESMAKFFRNNPSAGAYLSGFLGEIGESAYDSTGHLKSMVELTAELGKLMQHNNSTGQGYRNQLLADAFGGMDQNTMLAISNPKFLADWQKIQAEMNTPTFQHAVDGANQFGIALRGLENRLFIFGTQVVDVLQEKLGYSLDKVSAWFDANGEWLANQIVMIVSTFIDDFDKMVQWVQTNWPKIAQEWNNIYPAMKQGYEAIKTALVWLFDKFLELDTATGGWSTKLIALTAIFAAMGGFAILGGIVSLVGGIVSLGGAMLALSEGAGILAAIAGTLGVIATFGIGGGLALGAGIDYLLAKFKPDWYDKIGAWGADIIQGNDNKNMDDRRKQAIEGLTSQGVPLAHAIAITNGLEAETGDLDPSKTNPTSGAQGLGQWLGGRKVAANAYLQEHYHTNLGNASIKEEMAYLASEYFGGDAGAVEARRQMTLHEGNRAAQRYDWLRYGENPGPGLPGDIQRSQAAASHTMNFYITASDPHTSKAVETQVTDSLQQVFGTINRTGLANTR